MLCRFGPMMVITMKKQISGVGRAGAWVACGVLGLSWCGAVKAELVTPPAVVVAEASVQAPPIRLPACKLGGIRSGHVMTVTESGAESVQLTLQARKPSLLSEFCLVH